MKKNKYLLTGVITITIICFVYIIKGIFPFGTSPIAYGQMHEQITAIYYKFYDAVRGNASLLVDFNSGGGIGFFGIIAYYVTSPFSLLLLLFPRALLSDAISIVVALKVLAASLAMVYFLSKTFKKLKPSYAILLSLLYAFSSYTMNLYIMTQWMDAVYMLPFVLIGLRKLLDLEDNKTFIIAMTLSLIFSFYVSIMLTIFIMFGSIIYLYAFKKKNKKQAILNLVVSTLISYLISAFIILPSFLSIIESQRFNFSFEQVINSKLGPFSDKIAFLFTSGPLIATLILLLLKKEKHKDFLNFILPLLLIVGLPIAVEPINKILHLGSYVYFPYRYGFVLIFLLTITGAYFFEKVSPDRLKTTLGKYIPILSVISTLTIMLYVIIKDYREIKNALMDFTLTNDEMIVFIFLLILVVVILTSMILCIKKRNDKVTALFYVLIIGNILFNSFIYIGDNDINDNIKKQYAQMNNMESIKEESEYYYLKQDKKLLMSNYGMITGVRSLSSNAELTPRNNFRVMQTLGYDSYWMDTESIGGNLFIDTVLGQKYLVSDELVNDANYNFLENIEGLYYYELNNNVSFGYKINKSTSLKKSRTSFEASNIIYKSITGEDNIIETHDIIKSEDGNLINLKEIEELKETINVIEKEKIYLEIFNEFDNLEKTKYYNSFNIYVNNELKYASFPNNDRNGTLYLGTFENEQVEIRIIPIKETSVRNISIGRINIDKYNEFVSNNYTNAKVTFDVNTINVEVEGHAGELLFLPINYLDGMKSEYKLVKVFDNFIGIELKDGINEIEIVYSPNDFKVGIVLSIIGLLLFIIWCYILNKKKLPILSECMSYAYYIVIIGAFLIIYVWGILTFLLSFFIKI